VIQQGKVFKLKAKGADGQPLWAYRYRLEGRASMRTQVGGFASRAEAQKALRKALDREAALAARQSNEHARGEAHRGPVAEGRVRVGG
jgi:hypothetical protein